MLEPRPYQLECLEAINEFRSRGITRQLCNLPTGTGKTVVFSLLAKELNTRTIIIAHTEELIVQAKEKLEIVWPEAKIGIVKAGSDEIGAQIVIASIQTICRDKRLEKLKEQGFKLMIIDECHHGAAESYTKVIRELGFMDDDPNKLLVGVTATPKRGDGLSLGSIFQEIVFESSIGTMIRAGYLSNLVGKQIFTKVALENVGIKHGDFIQSELAKTVNIDSRNRLIVLTHTQYANERKKTLVFGVDVQHAKDLSALFNEHGISSKAVYGAMDKTERKLILKEFTEGKIQVLTNCQLLTEGFDEPSLDCIIMARPTKSIALFTQMIGRGTRTYPLKKDCLILDFCDNAGRNGLCNFKNTLDSAVTPIFGVGCDEGDEQYEVSGDEELAEGNLSKEVAAYLDRIQDIEFFDSSKFAWILIGDSWHLNLGQNRDVWVRHGNGGYHVVAQSDGDLVHLSNRLLPLDYALGLSEDWARRQTTKSAWARKDAPWRSQPASPKQIEALARMGISVDPKISKGEAAQILDARMNEPATAKQLWWLRSHGIGTKHGLTKSEARNLIAEAQKGVKSA